MKNRIFTLFCCCIFSFPLSLISQDTITITDESLQAGESYTWTRNNVYLLDGLVFLEEEGVLNIEPGTVVKAKKFPSDQSVTSALIISRGAQIFASGEPCNPIIFTSEDDDVADPEDIGQADRGLWGGLVLLGRGPLPEVCEDAFPGASPDDLRARYGGDPNCVFDDDDNSGVLRYVSIRHGGFSEFDGDVNRDFHSFFLGAVGRQTVVEHVEIYASGLSGIVVSGGNVNLKYAAAAFPAGDAFVWEKGWNGNGQFWFGIHGTDRANRGGDHRGLFQGVTSSPIVYNATFIGAGGENLDILQDSRPALSFLENSAGEYSNSIITEFTGFALKVEDTPDSSNDSYNQMVKGELRLKNNLWWSFGVNPASDVAFSDVISPNPEGDDPENDALLNHLLEFGNDLQNPLLNGISRTAGNQLDPRPGEGPAFENLAALPADSLFFDQVGYKGAFGDDLWVKHWTALHGNRHLVETPDCNFVVEADDLFVLEFSPDAPPSFINSMKDDLGQKATLLKECNCMGELSRLQLWENSNNPLEINTSTHSATTDVKVDTSGLGVNLVLDPEIVDDPGTSFCVQLPGNQGAKTYSAIVAVIDSGIDLPHAARDTSEGHPMLKGLAWWNDREIARDRLDNEGNCIPDDMIGYDYINGATRIIDSVGHGTHIAGTIADAFPDSMSLQLIDLKVYSGDSLNKSSVFDLTCAIHYAIDKGADVLNLSLGYVNKDPFKPLYNALKRAEDNGVIVIVSAGNDSMNLDTSFVAPEFNRWPGRFKDGQGFDFKPLTNILVVASLDPDENLLDTSFTNYGKELVDIAAKGTIRSAHLGNNELTMKGTSMSAAHVSRLAAIAKAYRPELAPHEIIKCIKDSSDLIKQDIQVNSGKLNIDRALDCLGIQGREIVKFPSSGTFPSGFLGYPSPLTVKYGEKFVITLGDGNTYYEDVSLIVIKGSETLFTISYCATNKIEWDGGMYPDGKKLQAGEQYFIRVKVGATTFSPQNVNFFE
jgi:subtilisin family serine protease